MCGLGNFSDIGGARKQIGRLANFDSLWFRLGSNDEKGAPEMSSPVRIEASVDVERSVNDQQRNFIPLILNAMSERNIGQRKLALRSGISKSRLGLLLHTNPARRAVMSLNEFQRILDALEINIVQAVITVETFRDQHLFHDERFATSLAMLTELFKGLPSMLVAALDEIEGMDGTEVRKEWAGPLRQALVEKLVKEVAAVMARREQISEVSRFGF